MYKNPNSTTTDIAKALYDTDTVTKMRNADRKVRRYLTDKWEHLVETENDGNKKRFSLKEDSLFFGLGKIEVKTFKENEITYGLGNVIMYMREDGEVNVETLVKEVDN